MGFAVPGVAGSYFFSDTDWIVLNGGSEGPLPFGVIDRGADCCTDDG